MRNHILIFCLLSIVQIVFAGNAFSAVEVSFGSNKTVSESSGNVWITLQRTGDLSVTTSVLYSEDWNTATLSQDELLFNHNAAPSTVSYNNSGRFGTVTFHSGVSQINIPYSITNDQQVENSEYIYFNITGANSSSGTTTIGNSRILIKVNDDDVSMPFVGIYPGTITDEGNQTRSFLVLSEPTTKNVTLTVSTNRNTYQEANYPTKDDYQEVSGLSFTIPSGSDFAWVPIQTYQNNDPNDQMYENFELCIDSGSVSGAIINVPCAKLVIKNIPETPPSVVASVIFEDALGSGWTDSSWGVPMNIGAESYDGAHGIEANFTYAWAGLSFSSDGFVTTGYNTLSFAIKGSTSNNGSEVVVVAYLTDGSVNNVPLTNYIKNTLASDAWQVVHIPLADVKAENSQINRVVFENGASGTLFIDELSFLTFEGVCK